MRCRKECRAIEMRVTNLKILLFAALFLALARAEEPAPPWLARAGTLRANDPALAKGKGAVQWRAWSADAFAEADRTQKPVYVFVTANWCHGGREMERAVLSDPTIANRLNADFIPVRLDRDAFPETDLRLQQAVSALKGMRGWPLNVFLTPDGEIFFGATFAGIEDDLEYNRPGMRSMLIGLSKRWADERAQISRDAASFCRAFKKNTEHTPQRGAIPADCLNASALKLQALFDRENGGFRSPAPGQFPEPRALEVCLAHFARTGDAKSLEAVEVTLDHMLNGGIYDQLDGGFHRSCVDKRWLLPRFEKLPVLNAEFIVLLLHTWQATGSARYRSAAEECLAFWRGELDVGGKFFCASIAPEAHSFEDGAFYAWSLRELELLFAGDPDSLRFARTYYGIGEYGNQSRTAPDRNILHVAVPLHEVARDLGIGIDDARKRRERVRERLRAARAERPRPPRDATALCDANAMMAAAFIESGRLLGREELTAQGLKTLHAILTERVNDLDTPRPVRHVLTDPSSAALAFDEAARAWACVQAYEATGDASYKQLATEALERLDRDYRDQLDGGYIERSFKAAPDFAKMLNWRTKSIQDTSEPSSNGLIAQIHARLYVLTGEAAYKDRTQTALESVGAALIVPGPYTATLALAADAVQNGVLRVMIIGRASDATVVAMLALANARYYPWKTVMRFDTSDAAGVVPVANLDGAKAFAIVEARGNKLVAETLEDLNKILREAVQAGK